MKKSPTDQEKINELLEMANQALSLKSYSEAKSKAERVLKIQPLHPYGLFYKGLAIVLAVNAQDVRLEYNELVAAKKAGRASKSKEDRLRSHLQKCSRAFQDGLLNFSWALKQKHHDIDPVLRNQIEGWILTCEQGLFSFGFSSEAYSAANVELATLMEVPQKKFELGMLLWNNPSNSFDVFSFAEEYYIAPAIANMSIEEARGILSEINQYAASNPSLFTKEYETFMSLWDSALQTNDRFKAAALQLPDVASRLLSLSDSVKMQNIAIEYLFRSFYEYSNPVSVRNNIVKSRYIVASQLSKCNDKSKDYVKSLVAYGALFDDLDEITGFMEKLNKVKFKSKLTSDDFEYDPYPLLYELHDQHMKLLKKKKEIERIKGNLEDMFKVLCLDEGYTWT